RVPPPPTSPLLPYTTLFRSLELQSLRRSSCDLASAAAGEARNGDDGHMLYSDVYALPRNRRRGYEHQSRPCISNRPRSRFAQSRSEEHTSELQSRSDLVCRL